MTSDAIRAQVTEKAVTRDRTNTSHTLAVSAAVLALLLAAMDATVMGTVLPKVLGSVGGGTHGGYAWLVSGFMLAQVAATPLAGWVSDRLDDRTVAISATVVFLAASVLAGLASSFPILVAARVLHGLAAGAIVVSSYVIVGRLFGPERRAAAQSLLSTVWGVAAVLGPVIGAAVTAAWGWRWVFFINVPLCTLVILAVAFALPRRAASPHSAGPSRGFPIREYALVTGGSALLLVGLQGASLGLGTVGGVICGVLGLTALVLVRKFGGNLLSRAVFTRSPSGRGALATIGACVVMYATVTVLPIRLAAHGMTTAGIAVVVGVSALGWVVASAVTGGLLAKYGYRLPMIAGGAALLVSAVCSATDQLPWIAGAAAGLGTGAVTAAALAMLQDQVPAAQIGLATSSATLLRNIGSAAGINGIATLSAVLASSSYGASAAFWTLAAVAGLAVVLPSLSVPRQRTVQA